MRRSMEPIPIRLAGVSGVRYASEPLTFGGTIGYKF